LAVRNGNDRLLAKKETPMMDSDDKSMAIVTCTLFVCIAAVLLFGLHSCAEYDIAKDREATNRAMIEKGISPCRCERDN
jgi:hypothetical protein